MELVFGMAFWLAFMALWLFGIGFNALTAFCESRGYLAGYTSLFVVLGVAVTVLASAAVIGLGDALLLGLLFSASGLPMIVGSIVRHVSRRQRDSDEALREVERALPRRTYGDGS